MTAILLVKKAQREIEKGDIAQGSADQHFLRAGQYLVRAKKKTKHGLWVPLLRKIGISKQRAGELMRMATGSLNIVDDRERKRKSVKASRAKSTQRSVLLASDACNYDWTNVSEADFGNPSKAYKAQAEQYRREAIHLATSYPLLSKKIDITIITETEVQAVRKVAQAWSDLAESLVQHKEKERA